MKKELSGEGFCIRETVKRAAIVCDRKRAHVGYFKNKRDAAKAYDKAATKLHREFARLNVPAR